MTRSSSSRRLRFTGSRALKASRLWKAKFLGQKANVEEEIAAAHKESLPSASKDSEVAAQETIKALQSEAMLVQEENVALLSEVDTLVKPLEFSKHEAQRKIRGARFEAAFTRDIMQVCRDEFFKRDQARKETINFLKDALSKNTNLRLQV